MKRKDFFKQAALTGLGAALLSPLETIAGISRPHVPKRRRLAKKAKNIIFLVSDGMSHGTLNMANLLSQRKDGRSAPWISLYEQDRIVRAYMDTASADSMVTDSAAASSAWGGGHRVYNGSINVAPDGTKHKPIWQKFKAEGKAVGCVTTVPITHATPAGFCVNSDKRSDQPGIALQYYDLGFDVMMGGGLEYFSSDTRKDKQDLFKKFVQGGYDVVQSRDALLSLSDSNNPILGVFHRDALPYALDRSHDAQLAAAVPTLAEMTKKALQHLKKNQTGFVLQVEGGKVDWAAHANDTAAILYEQLAFEEAVAEALAFADADGDTLIILTTDHGNASPGLFYGSKADAHFDSIQRYKHTNDWILNRITPDTKPAQLIEQIQYAQNWVMNGDEAREVLSHYKHLDGEGLYNPRKLPFQYFAEIQSKYTSVSWAAMDHSAEYVELAMLGPGSELLKPFVKNTDLHYLMLEAAGVSLSH